MPAGMLLISKKQSVAGLAALYFSLFLWKNLELEISEEQHSAEITAHIFCASVKCFSVLMYTLLKML